jgi:uncharacterized C2H2 Zn-finger protein
MPDTPYICPECGARFQYESEKNRHMQQMRAEAKTTDIKEMKRLRNAHEQERLMRLKQR